jgi:hypothetical protein
VGHFLRVGTPGGVSPSSRPAEVRFYFDADVLGLAKVIARLRFDATYPGDPGATIHRHERPACPIADSAVADRVWIPEVAQRGWLIITRDRRIQDHRAEIAAVNDHEAKMVVLSSLDATTTWMQLEILMASWRRIEPLHRLPDPFIFRATRTSTARVALE